MKKIAIISTNAIGDSYISCSAINTIKNKMGDTIVDLISLQDSKCFTDYLDINNAFLINKRSIENIIMLKKALSKTKYDYAFSFFPGRFNSIIINIIQSNHKYYYRNYSKVTDWHNGCQYLWVNNEKTNIYWDSKMNFLERINKPLKLLFQEPIKVQKPLFKFETSFKTEERQGVIINYQSRDVRKSLSVKILNEIIVFIEKELNLNVSVLNFENQFDHKFNIKNLLPNIYVFPELVTNILNSTLFITVDSFLLHIADAYKVRMLGLFNITNPDSVYESRNTSFLNLDYNEVSNLPLIKSEIRKLINGCIAY